MFLLLLIDKDITFWKTSSSHFYLFSFRNWTKEIEVNEKKERVCVWEREKENPSLVEKITRWCHFSASRTREFLSWLRVTSFSFSLSLSSVLTLTLSIFLKHELNSLSLSLSIFLLLSNPMWITLAENRDLLQIHL